MIFVTYPGGEHYLATLKEANEAARSILSKPLHPEDAAAVQKRIEYRERIIAHLEKPTTHHEEKGTGA